MANLAWIESTRKEYKEMLLDWQMIEPLMLGASSVSSQSRKFLRPVRTIESPLFYELRCGHLSFTPIYRHFVRLSAAIISRKPLRLEGENESEAGEEWQQLACDIDLRGNRIDVFANMLLECMFAYGRAGILVDAPRVTGRLNSKAEQAGLRPWWTAVRPFDLPSWQHERFNGREVLTYAKFSGTETTINRETGQQVENKTRCVYQLIDGKCQRQDYRQVMGEWQAEEPIAIELPYIPYFEPMAFSDYARSGYVVTPPLLDLAFLNTSHINLATNLDYSLNTNAIPRLMRWQEVNPDTPINPDYDQNQVNKRPDIDASPENIIDLPAGFRVDYLALPANIHADIAGRIKDLEEKAAKYWLTTIANQKAGAETENSKVLDREQGNSTLAVAAIALEDCLNNALMAARDMIDGTQIGQPMPVGICVNKKFELGSITVETARLLSDMQLVGQITTDQLINELVNGGLLTIG